ncbi:UNC93-like protein [Chrysoperla carnea]|uniref:UNC93-like protein n=1 Tax=Chrysoperla carnea TaxID=189513 RepID=UPI001D072AA7|nr:UNC93-like protein [Chrysoperla carnea]
MALSKKNQIIENPKIRAQIIPTQQQQHNNNNDVTSKKQFEDENIEFSQNEKWRIIKNVLIIAFAFMLHFTAFFGITNLQSSINANGALGTYTLAAIYGALILSNIFLPVLMISWFGCKWTIAISFISYMPYLMAQFHPTFLTMIPAGLAVGFGGGPLWCAKCTYLTVVSDAYAKITGDKSEVIVIRFFGLFFTLFQLSQVWGNLISSAVLSVNDEVYSNTSSPNLTTQLFYDTEAICGSNFCPDVTVAVNPNLKPPSEEKVNLISSIFLGCMIMASLLTAFGVDSLKRYNKNRVGSATGLSGLQLLAVTVKQLFKPYQLLLFPITMFIGIQIAFLSADFNASFVSCGWGISNIGFVMMLYGISNAVAATCTGACTKMIGRGPMIAIGTTIHVSILVTLAIWKPHPTDRLIFFIVATCWGVGDAILLITINALSGILYPGNEEASYSNFRFWESVGSVSGYLLSAYLCTSIKIYLIMGLLFIGIVGYTIVEYCEQKCQAAKTATIQITSDNKIFELVPTNITTSNNTTDDIVE